MLRGFAVEGCSIGVVTDHAIVVADADGYITWWSPSAEALFGHSAADALGQTMDLIIPGALRARHWAGFRRAMQAPQVKDLAADMPVLCADGQVKKSAGRLLVLNDGLGVALARWESSPQKERRGSSPSDDRRARPHNDPPALDGDKRRQQDFRYRGRRGSDPDLRRVA